MGLMDDLRRELEKAAQETKRQVEIAAPPQTGAAPGDFVPTAALPLPPAKRLAVVTCMDTRVLVEKALNLRAGDAHILRNAGGLVTDDVLRSLAVSHHLLGIEQIFVVGHTDCGLMTFRDADLRAHIRQKMGPTANLPGAFGAFSDPETNVRVQMRRIRASGLFPPALLVRGFVYELKTGRLNEVAPAGIREPAASSTVPAGLIPTARVDGRLVRQGLQKVASAPTAAPPLPPSAEDFRRKVETMEQDEAAPLNALVSSPAFDLGLPESAQNAVSAPDSPLGANARELIRAFVLGGVLNKPRGRGVPRR